MHSMMYPACVRADVHATFLDLLPALHISLHHVSDCSQGNGDFGTSWSWNWIPLPAHAVCVLKYFQNCFCIFDH